MDMKYYWMRHKDVLTLADRQVFFIDIALAPTVRLISSDSTHILRFFACYKASFKYL